MASVYISTEIEVDLDEFDIEDLKDELNSRGLTYISLDEYEVKKLSADFELALYSNNQNKIIEAAKEYFKLVHRIYID